MKKLCVAYLLCILINSLRGQYNSGYVPKYLQQRYGLENGHPNSANTNTKTSYGHSGTKSFTKTKNSYTSNTHITKLSNLGTKFRGGCVSEPTTPMNAAMKCSQYSGCRIDCIPQYQFPDGNSQIFVTCQNGNWSVEGTAFEFIPPCEPICLPACLNGGICYAPNQCNCAENFSGPQCQFENKPCLNYPPMPVNARRMCRSNTCTITCMEGHHFPDGSSIAQMICKNGQWIPAKEQWVAIPDCEATCNPPCANGGNCLSFNVCQCPQDFRGPQCQYRADACSARKLLFNGGYNCSGDAESFSCSVNCPEGVSFEFPPAPYYTCHYSTGVFVPVPIPQCNYSPNMNVIPVGSSSHTFYRDYNSTFNLNSMSVNGKPTFGHIDWNIPVQPTFENESNIHVIPMVPGMTESQYVVVEEKLPEPSTCFTWGGTHYKTFDGKVFSFVSKCAHTLVRDALDNTFSIVVQNDKNCTTYSEKCHRIIKIYLNDKEYILKQGDNGLPVFSTPKKVLSIPGQLPGLRIEMQAHFISLSLDTVGLKIKWDGKHLVQIEAKENLWKRTQGLCGKLDGDPTNDVVSKDGLIPSTVTNLALSWQADTLGDECNEIPTEERACKGIGITDSKASEAKNFCNKLLSDKRFEACKKIVDMSTLLDACQWDYCSCQKPEPAECACETINIYVQQCFHKGIKSMFSWRDENMCPMKCTGGKVYLPCGPSKGQPVCGASTEVTDAEESCIEGCYCPEGMVLHESNCITRDKCPCKLRGKSFPAGSSVPKDCNTCTCSDGQWTCTQVSCGARCSAIGDPHYITFDGKRYDFMGQCSYYLLVTDNFTVEAENVACAGSISQAMNLPVSISLGLPSCTKTVTIKTNGQKIKLKQNHEITVNGQEVTKLPYFVSNSVIRSISSMFLQVQLPGNVNVWWDGITRAYIDVPASLKGKTKGLCGTFNDNQKDDFLTPEDDVEQSIIPFANKWKTSEKCNDVPEKLLESPCDMNVQNKMTAEMHCKKLKSDLFKECHWYVDPESFYQDCMYDMCSCETKITKCLCPMISAYAQECAAKGIKINWREEIRECGIHCPGGQKYQICGNSCTRSCHDVATRLDCKPQCVEGCNCLDGEALNDVGECIPIGQCTCQLDGLEFPASYKEVRPASKAPELCTCVNAQWSCRMATSSEIKEYPSANDKKSMCSASKNMEFTTCEPVEPTTCKNMHRRELVSAAVCHPGCQCKAGYVFDSTNKICVKPTECPCHHGGKSYKENSTIQSECNTCTCKNSKWKCTDRQCSAECNTWGDSHFKTFDGKMYDYQGQCDYIFAKGVLSDDECFDIILQNVPCSSLGVSCSKSVTIKIGKTENQQESVTLERGKPVPHTSTYKRLTIRTEGLFVIVEVADLGLIIYWDKGTRVYLKVDPRWKNKVKGLCGNYNDNQQDDFQTPSGGISEVSANIFGDSWRLQSYCPEALEVTSTCEERPERKIWALKQCGILKSSIFAPCHSEVPIDTYFDRCVFDTCACDQGGDCECLCTALAAYAQECNNKGIPIKWRSQELCPMQCDERCSQYSPCISTCPLETCDNLLLHNQLSKLCKEDTCIEGCRPKPCPPGHIYVNSSYLECIPKSVCKPVCLEIEDVVYYEGDLMEEDECHSCYCSRGKKKCKGVPCSTNELLISTPEPQKNQVPLCEDGWTEWINQDKEVMKKTKSKGKSTDIEPLPSGLIMNTLKGPKCNLDEIVDIKCRTVKDHTPAKETGLDVECSLEKGLICKSAHKGTLCPDFEIQVLCRCEENIVTVPPESVSCDVNKPNQEHPTDCHLFYHCVPGIDEPTMVEKSCGANMMYNPITQVCDWPDNVIKIRDECGEKRHRLDQTEKEPSRCPPGEVYEECAQKCDQMCLYYTHILVKRGICKNGTTCAAGCISAHKKMGSCPPGMFWADSNTCVSKHDCLCYSDSGKPVKPGVIYKESECKICQCIDNFYTCDTSSCAEETQEELEMTTVAPVIVTHVPSTVTPPKDCDDNRFIDLIQGPPPLSDEAFNASSALGSAFEAKFARIGDVGEKMGDSWSPEVSNKDQYLQVDLGHQEPIYGVVIKGSPLFDQYVTSFYVLYSPDGHNYEYIFDGDDKPKIFGGSFDSQTPVKQMFTKPVEAKIVRINPQTWHNSISLKIELIGCGELKTTVSTYTTSSQSKYCVDTMGLHDGTMSDRQVSVSSEFGPNNEKKHLKLDDETAWQPLTNSPTEWIEFDFLEPRNITGIITQGGPNGWVSAYKVEFSHDHIQWNSILDGSANERVFPGNFDRSSTKTNNFERPVSARYIKIVPQKWKHNIQMRVEPQGCFIPYPEIEEVTTVIPSLCNYCPGVQQDGLELGACRCAENLWWDGENCVVRNRCPCMVGHIPYSIGAIFEKEDCSECICKLGGVAHCSPKKCDKCEKGLKSVITSTCACTCQPCGKGMVLCPTSNICINETYWCNGIQDCPDDEVNCATTEEFIVTVTPTETTAVTEKIIECPKIECPPGFAPRKVSKVRKYHSYLSPMFSVYGRKTKSSHKTLPLKTATKGGRRKSLQHPKNVTGTSQVLEEKCPEFTCRSTKPPPPLPKDKKCSPIICPPNFVPAIEEIETKSRTKVCPTFTCQPQPPPDAVCNVTGRTFNTFDEIEYKYDICDHILARDLVDGEWDVSLKKNCSTLLCERDLIIHHQEHDFILHPDLSIEYDGHKYTVEQTKKIGSRSQFFSISRLGNTLLFVSNRYGFWIIWDKQGNVKVGIVRKLSGKVDGLCGYFDENPDNDKRKPDGSPAKTTADFGDSWSQSDQTGICEAKACPLHIQNKAWDICNQVKHQAFDPCTKSRNSFISRCLEMTCLCLEAAEGNETAEDICRCDTLQTFVVDCLTADPNLELIDWRMQHDCPATCDAPLVYHDCYQRRCEHTCDTVSDSNLCPKLPNICFPGCYCPPGYVKNGDDCILPSACRDCECNVLPHLQYVTYDDTNFTVNGNCVYVMSRDETTKNEEHKFQVLITNAPCQDQIDKMCVGKVTILYEGHKIHILRDTVHNKLKVIIDGERLNDFSEVENWALVKQKPTKHIKIFLNKIQVSVSIYFPSLGVSVKAPSHKYGGKLEGLCGDCNKNADNDMSLPNGTLTDDANVFGLSWLYDNLPGGQNKETCANKPQEDCPPIPIDLDPCVQLLDIHRFGQCHALLDPSMFIEWCKKDTCGNHPERACTSIEAYARDCLNSGFCVDWHSDLCPIKSCPPGLMYNACGSSCQVTCENFKEKNKKCSNIPTEGCFCPEGKALLNNTCVDLTKCEVCDEEGHHPGDVWQKDACTSCTCDGTILKCETKHCPQIDTLCEEGFTAIKTEGTKDKCCDEFICVPEATASPTCEPPQKVLCAPGQVMKINTKPDGCQQFICQCKPIEECEEVSVTTESPLEVGYERVINNSGCCPVVELLCKEELCPKSPECPQYYTQNIIPGKCCPHYQCVPPVDKCIFDTMYTADEKGGERVRTKYEEHKILKNLNDTWQDGPCRDCKCQNGSNGFQAICSKTECPSLESATDFADYVIEAVPIYNQCCPNLVRVGCKDNDMMYKVGEKWSPSDDFCTVHECVENSKGISKQTQVTSCDVTCDLGWEYIPASLESKQCCGSCKPVACVIDGVVHKVGEEWTSDDFCTNYFCLNLNGSLQVQSVIVNCPKIPKDLQNDYVLNISTVDGECCPKHEIIGCKEGEKQYMPGDNWPSPDGNSCKKVSCVENDEKIVKQVSVETCDTECKIGWEYKKSNITCCGKCVSTACVIDGILKQANETWTSSDKCTTYTCEQLGDQYTVVSQQESCPSIEDCAPENVYIKGCCKHCNVTSLSQGLCVPEEIKGTKSVGLVKQFRPPHGQCENKEPLQGFTECVGSCHSSTFFNAKSGSHESVCTCCQATKYKPLLIELQCEDGYRFKKQIAVPSDCGCEGCTGAPIKNRKVTKSGVKTG